MNTTTNTTTQALTLVTAIAVGNEWTSAELNQLRAMKAEGATVADIALAIGRSYYGVSSKLTEAGMTKPRESKPVAAEVACDACWLIHRGECF
jgi:hypothetical protein